MKLPTFSATQNGIAAKNPMSAPRSASLAATIPNIHQIGSPGGMFAWTQGMAIHASPIVAARRATPGIIDSVSAGQIANAPPNLAMTRTAARIQRWNSR